MMKLEDATCKNTREYSLTGLCLRSKLLWKMQVNNCYGVVAVEHPNEIYKAYIWSSKLYQKKIGDIFYVIFEDWDDETRGYHCEIHDNCKSQDYIDANEHFKPKYDNKHERYLEYNDTTSEEEDKSDNIPEQPKRKLKITALLETSDHDGYCTDNECEYATKTETYIVDFPEDFRNDLPIGVLDEENRHNHYWKSLLPKPELNNSGSHYCSRSKECMYADLGCHDYLYKVLSVEIVEPI